MHVPKSAQRQDDCVLVTHADTQDSVIGNRGVARVIKPPVEQSYRGHTRGSGAGTTGRYEIGQFLKVKAGIEGNEVRLRKSFRKARLCPICYAHEWWL